MTYEEWGESWKARGFTVFESNESPEEAARRKADDEAFLRNEAWMKAHWEELWPQARGKVLVVAGEEAFIADTIEEALAQAWAAHPEERGSLVTRHVFPDKRPRIYVGRG